MNYVSGGRPAFERDDDDPRLRNRREQGAGAAGIVTKKMKTKKHTLNILTIGLALMLVIGEFLFMGCQHKLELGGAYAPGYYTTNTDGTLSTNFTASAQADVLLFGLDAAYKFAYSTVNNAFTYERSNEAALWKLSPDIKHTLDDLRPKAKSVRLDWAKARAAYLDNPSPANLSALQSVVAKVQSFANVINAVSSQSAEKLTLTNP